MMKASRLCRCGAVVASGRACACQAVRRADYNKRRGSARQRGYGTEWEKASRAFLALPENRFCICGCGRRADLVDHKVPHRGDMALFWDRGNWQAMAFGCHSAKTAAEDGGFGNPRRAGAGAKSVTVTDLPARGPDDDRVLL